VGLATAGYPDGDMTFIQLEFLWLFLLVYALYWGGRNRVWQNLLLAVTSAIFYGWVHPWFLLLLYGSAVLDYTMGRGMAAYPEHRKKFLLISMAGNLGMLGYFKYCDFFIENVIAALSTIGLETSLHTLGIFLPVGISFYTFQTMSYTIDIYRGDLEPRKNFLDYLVFVSFFPQLVAGPVERAKRLLPQVEQERKFDLAMLRSGFGLAMWGAFKKVCIADQVSPYVDKIFIHSDPSGPMIWAATLGFSVQILADFSGYTDIARGTSRMLGFELMENFKSPYLARNPSDFWRRWHVSFSTWIRDYIYFTLGGSRGGFWDTVRATFGAMVLSGLWHGAAWTFVIWGAYHAAILTGYRLVTQRIPKAWRDATWGDWAAIAIMFFFTNVGWLIFRETHIDRLLHFFSLSPFGGTAEQWVAAGVMFGVAVTCALPLVLAAIIERHVLPRIRDRAWYLPVQTTSWSLMAVAVLLFVRSTAQDFIYFQF
jgi:alginate O-acetyltransferase complex protein AlgI